jgi:hypothetical protein
MHQVKKKYIIPVNKMSLVKEIQQKLNISAIRKCPKCGVEKDAEEDFHIGASMCKTCKRQADKERRLGGRVVLTNAELHEIVMKMAVKIDKLEKAVVKLGGKLEDDDEDFGESLKKSGNPQKTAKEKLRSKTRFEGFTENDEKVKKPKSKSDKDTGDDDSDKEVVKKPKSKLKLKPDVETNSEVVKKPKMPDNMAEIIKKNKNKDKRRK